MSNIVEIEGTEKDTIKWIWHIADIHIKKNLNRREEFQEIFENLYQKIWIEKITKKNSYIVIAGDLLDDGVNLKANSIDLLSKSLIKLSKLARIFIIAGNHDNDIKGSTPNERIDSLSALFEFVKQQGKNARIHYLRDTGIYRAGNCLLYVPSIFDLEKYCSNSDEDYKKRIKILPKRINEPDKYHILIGHFSLDNTETPNGYLLKNLIFKVSDIEDKYDICLLGDNHKTNNILGTKQNIGYPGSLLQLNYGEQYGNHGILLWDLKNKSSSFKTIVSSYGYVTLDLTKENFKLNLDTLPINARIRLKFDDINKCNQIENKLNKQDNINILEIRKDFVCNNNEIQTTISEIDIQNNNNLIDYLNQQYPNQHGFIKQLTLLHEKYTKELRLNTEYVNIKIKLIKLEFENFICFRNKITIDFSVFPINKSIGILGENGNGKSTIMKALKYNIHGIKSLDSDKNESIKNIYNRNNVSKTSLQFDYSGTKYKISRNLTKKNQSKLTFQKLQGEKWINASGRKKSQYQDDINKIFGTKDIMCETWFSEQTKYNNFLNQTPGKRVLIFKQLLNLTQYENQIEKKNNSELKQINEKLIISKTKINQYKQQINNQTEEKFKQIINQKQKLEPELQNQINLLTDEVNSFKGKYYHISNSNINDKKANLKRVKRELKRVETGETNIIIPDNFNFDFQSKNNEYDSNISNIETQITELQKQLKPVDSIYNKHTLKNANSEKKVLITKYENTESDKAYLTKQLTTYLTSIE